MAEALERSARLDGARKANAEPRAHYQALTPREREVFVLVAAGLLNKIVADRLHIAEKTVKVHRHRVIGRSLDRRSRQDVRAPGALSRPPVGTELIRAGSRLIPIGPRSNFRCGCHHRYWRGA